MVSETLFWSFYRELENIRKDWLSLFFLFVGQWQKRGDTGHSGHRGIFPCSINYSFKWVVICQIIVPLALRESTDWWISIVRNITKAHSVPVLAMLHTIRHSSGLFLVFFYRTIQSILKNGIIPQGTLLDSERRTESRKFNLLYFYRGRVSLSSTTMK